MSEKKYKGVRYTLNKIEGCDGFIYELNLLNAVVPSEDNGSMFYCETKKEAMNLLKDAVLESN